MPVLNDINSLFKSHPIATLIIEPREDFCIVDANDAFVNITKMPLEKLLHKPLFEVFPDQDIPNEGSAIKCIQKTFKRVIETRHQFEIGPLRYDLSENEEAEAHIHYWETYSSPMLDEAGKLEYIIYAVKDVTEQILLEEENAISQLFKAPGKSGIVNPFKALFDNALNGMILSSADGRVLEANRFAAEIFGYTVDELKTLHRNDLIKSDDNYLADLLKQKGVDDSTEGEIIGTRKNGEKFICEYAKSLFAGLNGEICSVTIVSDITAKKKAEVDLQKSEKRFKALIANLEEIIALTDVNGFITYVNPAYERVTGYKMEELASIKSADLLHPTQFSESKQLLFDLYNAPGKPFHRVSRLRHKDGHFIWLEGTVTNLLNEEGVNAFVSNYRDITEAKKAQKLLETSESNLRAIFDNSVEGFVLANRNLKIIAFNSKASEYILLKDLPAEFKVGEDLLNYIEPPWDEYFKEQIDKALEGNVVQYDRPLYKEGQGSFYFSFSIYPVKENGKITGVCISGRDVTEQKLAEYELEKSEKKYRCLIENSSDGVIVMSAEGFIEYLSFPVENITGYRQDDLLGMNILTLIHEENKEDFTGLFESIKTRNGTQIKNRELKFRNKDGSVNWMELTITNMLHNESIRGIVVNFRNVSERKNNELQILALNARLTFAQKIAKLGYWDFNVQLNELFWSDEHYKLWGLPVASSVSFNQFINTIHEDDRARFLQYHDETIGGKHDTNIIYRIIRPDGQVLFIHAIGTSVLDAAGKVVKLEGTVQDVTERIRAEESIAESEEKYRKMFENSPLPKWIYDIETLRILEVNEAAIESYGYSREEFLNFTIFDFRPIEDFDELNESINTRSKDRTSRVGQWRHRKKNGELINVEVTSHAITFNNRECKLVVALDITERIKAEKELLQSNERFRLATKATSDAIWDFDLLNDRIYLGEGFSTLFGFDSEVKEVDSSWMSLNIHPDDYEKVWNGIGSAIQSADAEFWKDEYRYKRADGNYAIVVNEAVLVRDERGVPYRMIGAMKDVTLDKEEEHRLRLMESVVTNTTDAVMITTARPEDEDGVKIVYINNAFMELTGFSAEEIIGKSTMVLNGPETDHQEIEKLNAAMTNCKSCSIQTQFYKKNGETYWGSLAIAPVADASNEVKNYIAICRDVSNIQNYIHEIEEQNKKLREIAWIQSHVVRAPLSRIMGLINILTVEPDIEELQELLPMLYQSALDLDESVKEIVSKAQAIDDVGGQN